MPNSTTQATAQFPVTSLPTETKFQLIQEITLKISTSLDLEEMLELIIDTVRSFVFYDVATIYVLESSEGEQKVCAQVERGYNETNADCFLRLKAGEGLVGWVMKNGQGVIIPDVRTDDRYIKTDPKTLSEIVAPIMANGKVIGAFNLENYKLNAYTETDLEVLTFFAGTVSISIEKAFLHKERLEKKRLESELTVARQVQLSLLPEQDPIIPGFDISGANFSSTEISGDYFDFIQFPNQQLGISIADVSGKGIPSALIMASFRASLRAQVRNEFAIKNIFRKVNYLLWESVMGPQFVTAVYGVLDPYSGRFSFADAGHNPMLLLRKDGSYQEISCGNTVLGLFEDREYKECNRRIKPGETLVLYTDGVTEATRNGIEFGVEGLIKVLQDIQTLPAREMVNKIYEAVLDYTGKEVLNDDLTVVIIKALDQGVIDINPE